MNNNSAANILVLSNKELPPDFEEISKLCNVEVSDDAILDEQLTRNNILYAWDYFWDRQTKTLENAWTKDAAIKWAHIANVGVDKISFPKLLNSVSFLTNSQGVYEKPIAEYVLATYLFFAKQLDRIRTHQKEAEWVRFESKLITGTNAVVLGAGPIGRAITSLLEAVGIKVTLVGRSKRVEPDGRRIESFKELPALVKECELLVLVAPLTEETRQLIDRKILALLNANSVLINVARGELINDSDLIEALKNKKIAGAALDVFSVEPLPEESPYWNLSNCLVSSHLSGVTSGWRQDLAAIFTKNLGLYLKGQKLMNIV